MAFWMADQAARVGGAFSIDFGDDIIGKKGASPDWLGTDEATGKADELDWFGMGEKKKDRIDPLAMLRASKTTWN